MDKFFKIEIVLSVPDYYFDDVMMGNVSGMDYITVHPEANLHDIEEQEMTLVLGTVCADCQEATTTTAKEGA